MHSYMGISEIVLLTLFVLIGGIFGITGVPKKNRALTTILIVLINAVPTSIPSALTITGILQTAIRGLPVLPCRFIAIRID